MKKVILLLLLTASIGSLAADDLQLFEAGKKAFSVGLYTIALENLEQYIGRGRLDKRVDALYLSGISSFYLKNYSDSISYLEGLVNEYPESGYSTPATYWIGLNYYYKNDFSEAIIWFNRNIETSNSFLNISLLYKALSNIQIGDAGSAEESFNRIINSDSAKDRYRSEALYRLSTMKMESFKYNEAVINLNSLILDYPDSKYYMDSLSLLCDAYFLLEEWDNALRSYTLLEDFSGSTAELNKKLAVIYYNLGINGLAKDRLYRYEEEIPGDEEVISMLGDILLEENNLSAAAEIYSKLPTPENNNRVGKIYYKLEDYNRAYDYLILNREKDSDYLAFLAGLKSDKDISKLVRDMNRRYYNDDYVMDSNNRYINNLEATENRDELKDFLTFLTDKYPKNINFSLALGELHLEDGEFEDSLKYLSRGYNPDSDYYSNISYKIGWIYFNKSEFSRSIEYFNRVDRKDNDFIKALYSKSIANYKIGALEKGRLGFMELLESDNPYRSEVGYYLGLISKESQDYDSAIGFFTISLDDVKLNTDSLENIAWCNYHLKNYEEAVEIYLELGNSFNAANCFYFMEEFERSLELYKTLYESEFARTSYYKSIEILFKLERVDSAFIEVDRFKNAFPDSELPGDSILIQGENYLYGGRVELAIETFLEAKKIFKSGRISIEADFRLAEAYYLTGEVEKSITLYENSIINKDKFYVKSVESLTMLLAEEMNPNYNSKVIERLDSAIEDKSYIIPIYLEYIKQSITEAGIEVIIDELLGISRSRDEIDNLIYLKALSSYTKGDSASAEESLGLMLQRPEVDDNVKIDSVLLTGRIYSDRSEIDKAIDLYLNLYVNFSEHSEKASLALYNGLQLAKDSDNNVMRDKIMEIITNEYPDTEWGIKALNEK